MLQKTWEARIGWDDCVSQPIVYKRLAPVEDSVNLSLPDSHSSLLLPEGSWSSCPNFTDSAVTHQKAFTPESPTCE